MNNPNITKLSLLTILILILVAVNVWLIQRLPVSAAGEPLTISAPVTFSGGYTISSPQFIDTANSAYFLDPAATGDSLVVAGTATASGNLTVGNTNAIRSAFGPLTLQYKSALDAWATGLTIQDTTGNVGIGTTSVTSKLTVAGTVESTTGGFKFPDATTQTSAAAGETSGQIAFFATTCPSGWTEYTAARGMYIVGNPASGTLATAVGTALTNLENRPVGQHLHSVDPASTGVSVSDPGHTHSIRQGQNEGGDVQYRLWYQGSNIGNGSVFSSTTGITASVDIAAFNSANAGSVAGTNAPYIQLTACQKN